MGRNNWTFLHILYTLNISHEVSKIFSNYKFSQDYNNKQWDTFPYLVTVYQILKSIQALDQQAHPSFTANYITPYSRSLRSLKKGPDYSAFVGTLSTSQGDSPQFPHLSSPFFSQYLILHHDSGCIDTLYPHFTAWYKIDDLLLGKISFPELHHDSGAQRQPVAPTVLSVREAAALKQTTCFVCCAIRHLRCEYEIKISTTSLSLSVIPYVWLFLLPFFPL